MDLPLPTDEELLAACEAMSHEYYSEPLGVILRGVPALVAKNVKTQLLREEAIEAADWLGSFREPMQSMPHEEELVADAHMVAGRLRSALGKIR